MANPIRFNPRIFEINDDSVLIDKEPSMPEIEEEIKVGQIWGQKKSGGFHITWEILSTIDESTSFNAQKIIKQRNKIIANEEGVVSRFHLLKNCILEKTTSCNKKFIPPKKIGLSRLQMVMED